MRTKDEPQLICMVGLPRAGKSTWVRDFYIPHGYAVVSPDTIRSVIHGKAFIQSMEHIIWGIVYAMADSLLKCGCKVVIDATAINHSRRASWVERGAVFHHVPTAPEICLSRACAQSNACDIIPIIHGMVREFQPLDESKGEIEWTPPAANIEEPK